MPDHDVFKLPGRIPVRGSRLSRRRRPTVPAPTLDRSILGLLADAGTPLSAYDLVERLRHQGAQVVAMSVYRSLDRLSGRDQIQKVEMLSAYRVKDTIQPILMICIACGATQAAAAPDLHEALAQSLHRCGFVSRRVALEVAGLCTQCRTTGEA